MVASLELESFRIEEMVFSEYIFFFKLDVTCRGTSYFVKLNVTWYVVGGLAR